MPWVKLDTDFSDHPKVIAAGAEGMALYVAGLCYCARHETDGRIPKAAVKRLVELRKPMQVAEMLVSVGLWDDDEGGCYIVRDYLEYQTSKAQMEEIRQQKREAGRRGGLASGESRRGSKHEAEAKQSASPSGSTFPNLEVEVENRSRSKDQPTGRKYLCPSCGDDLDPDGYCHTCSVVRL